MDDPALGKATLLMGHINELRYCLFKAILALLFTTAISFAFAQQIIILLATPLGGIQAMVSIEITENSSILMKVSILGGVILTMPVIIYQIMRLILPGLEKHEVRQTHLPLLQGVLQKSSD